MIVIVDYGMGNVGSIQNMIKKIGGKSIVSSDETVVHEAERLILPGVGAFDNGMRNLANRGLIPILNDKVLVQKTPILGICLGMQLFTRRSEEGTLNGLGWFDAETIRFSFQGDQAGMKIPHMGWNYIESQKESPLLKELSSSPRYYFVHSYHVVCYNKEDVLASTNYGKNFVSAIQRDNIFAVQFHPEKSHKYGLQLLKNFVEMKPCSDPE